MCRRSNRHDADGSGRPRSGSTLAGMDGPMIGAGALITIDGIVERESGATPPPPPISVKALVVALIVMFLLGVALLTLFVLLR
jgi:hypothetical protein